MIVFDLVCPNGHRFEGWFSSASDFDSQRKRRLLTCPSCDSAKIERIPSASRLNFGAKAPAPAKPQQPQPQAAQAPAMTPEMEGKDPFAIAQMLYSQMLDNLLTKAEDVGRDFPDQARKIYYGEVGPKTIRGEATQKEHDELLDEGIPVVRFSIPKPEGMN